MIVASETGIYSEKPLSHIKHIIGIFPLYLGALLSPIDYFIVNLALGNIASDMRATHEQLSWIITSYALSYAITLIPAGRLGDKFGRKCLFIIGLCSFMALSLLCGLTDDIAILLIGRFIQGISAALLSPQVLATIRATIPMKVQTVAVAIYGFIFGLGAIIGQIGGGVLISINLAHLGWRVIFLINLPVGLISFIGTSLWVKENKGDIKKKIDYCGALLLCLTLFTFLIPLALGPEKHWPLWTWIILGISIIVLWILFQYEVRQADDAIVNIRLLSHPIVGGGLILALLFYCDSLFFMTFPIFLEQGLHDNSWKISQLLVFFAMGFIIGPLLTPYALLFCKTRLLPLSFLILVFGFFMIFMGITSSHILYGILIAGLIIAGTGHGIVLATLARTILLAVQPIWAGLAASTLTCAMQIGSAIGVSILDYSFMLELSDRPTFHDYVHAFHMSLLTLIILDLIAVILGFYIHKKMKFDNLNV